MILHEPAIEISQLIFHGITQGLFPGEGLSDLPEAILIRNPHLIADDHVVKLVVRHDVASLH